ncbi:MAG: preprotein translocase subunit SecY [Candidatus Moranbacteria bacterium CG_4_8_14_3_um_filter_34_16]|nr:MAG: preprotein translocase subunit SecY [Candidatus Moranbacteria bacterium CG_4_8_14_3_um_filter_34_16]PJA89243.1 MAG: preprotein translocase subunit SecY [Candidatus Moranbacteria bacterium CG_4_9_14_3_um_filter_33_15]
MFQKIFQIFKIKDLRDKIVFILILLVIFRLAANIPIPGIDQERLKVFFEGNQFFGLLNLFSGRGLSGISIAMLGVGPYITASIIMQLMTMIIPRLEQIYKEEGEAGRQKFNQWTRWITVPLAILQTIGMISLFRSQGILNYQGPYQIFSIAIIATAGTIFLMWLGELITEKKIGNGVSLLIFAGIISGLPSAISGIVAVWDSSQLFSYMLFLAIVLASIGAVVFVTEGQRNIPVSYAKRVRGNKMYGGNSTHLPLRINQAGVIPIIFAISIMLFPGVISSFFSASSNQAVAGIAKSIGNIFQNQWFYGTVYFILVVAFTYFYTAVVFDPQKIAQNLQKQGGYIPGIRPGKNTTEYLYKIMNRVTLSGAAFLGLIAVLPFVVQGFTNIGSVSVGGTGLLIVVSVVIETIKQIEGQLIMRDYESF